VAESAVQEKGETMRVLVLGGDGFTGWPTALHLSAKGHDVAIVDNLSRRNIDNELGTNSLTPIATVNSRLAAWEAIGGNGIAFFNIDIATEPEALFTALWQLKPEAIVHFAEQRAAPYSMKTAVQKRYTVDNNIRATHNLLSTMVSAGGCDCHLIHLGSMGVYGYGATGGKIPEGYLRIFTEPQDDNHIEYMHDGGDAWTLDGEFPAGEILHPTAPGSVYHMTKCMDAEMFAFYAKNDGLRITDLHQGIVWGTNTEETNAHPALQNRFDYCGDYGTVLNRFLAQAAAGYPLTVHGTGGQTRAFIHIRDTVRCVELALDNPPDRGERVRIFNQATECHKIEELAKLVASLMGAEIAYTPNPRKEAAENELMVANDSLIRLGLEPHTLSKDLLTEIHETAYRYRDRIDTDLIPCMSTWTDEQQPGVPE